MLRPTFSNEPKRRKWLSYGVRLLAWSLLDATHSPRKSLMRFSFLPLTRHRSLLGVLSWSMGDTWHDNASEDSDRYARQSTGRGCIAAKASRIFDEYVQPEFRFGDRRTI